MDLAETLESGLNIRPLKIVKDSNFLLLLQLKAYKRNPQICNQCAPDCPVHG